MDKYGVKNMMQSGTGCLIISRQNILAKMMRCVGPVRKNCRDRGWFFRNPI